MNSHKDNVLTIPLPGSNLVFTRYLYVKDEVQMALLISLLNKSDDALFWAYELFHSGFQIELLKLLWKIYYDFFATLNPSFEIYLNKKQTIYQSDLSKREKIISSIINNLLIRDFNTDVFMMRKICEMFEKDDDESDELKCKAYEMWSTRDTDIPFQVPLSKLLVKRDSNNSNNSKKRKTRNFYVQVDPDSLQQYRTLESGKPAYTVLKEACKCAVDSEHFLSLFKLERPANIREKYSDKWLYHASFSPVWFDRIKEYKGYVDYVKNVVKFANEDFEELFHAAYGYEPDEQPLQIKDRAVPIIEKRNTWSTFYHKFKNDHLIEVSEEELSEF
jgi:hypothetical protein